MGNIQTVRKRRPIFQNQNIKHIKPLSRSPIRNNVKYVIAPEVLCSVIRTNKFNRSLTPSTNKKYSQINTSEITPSTQTHRIKGLLSEEPSAPTIKPLTERSLDLCKDNRLKCSEIVEKVRNFNDFLNSMKKKLKTNSQDYESTSSKSSMSVSIKLQNEKVQLEKYRRLVERELSKQHSIENIKIEKGSNNKEKILTIDYQSKNFQKEKCEQQSFQDNLKEESGKSESCIQPHLIQVAQNLDQIQEKYEQIREKFTELGDLLYPRLNNSIFLYNK